MKTLRHLIKETFQNSYTKDVSQLMLLEKKQYKTVDSGSANFRFKNTANYLTQMKLMKKESLKIQKDDLHGLNEN